MSKIKEKMSLSFEGVLNVEDFNIEIENFEQPVDLEHLLRPYDGKFVKVNITVSNEVNENK